MFFINGSGSNFPRDIVEGNDRRQLLYVRVAQALMADIRCGRFAGPLPREEELALLYGASRATVRSALQELRNNGAIYTQHGKGTFIAQRADDMCLRLDKFKGFYQMIEDSGHVPTVRNLSLSQVANLKTDYALPTHFFNESVFVLERLIYSDDLPAVYVRKYIPLRHLKNARPDISPNSIYEIAEAQISEGVAYTISEITAVTPGSAARKHFNTPRGRPLVMLRECHFSQDNQVLIYSEACINNLQSVRLSVLRRE